MNKRMTMRDLMLDLETMGNGPRAAIMAIGAVEFKPETGAVGERFYQAVDLATAVSMGGEMDASTVMWWMQQSDDARAKFAKGGVNLSKALMDFSTWLHERGAPDYVRVWWNGATFDNVILASAYRTAMQLQPWRLRLTQVWASPVPPPTKRNLMNTQEVPDWMIDTSNLPPLPAPARTMHQYGKKIDHFTADQMHAYAQAALDSLNDELEASIMQMIDSGLGQIQVTCSKPDNEGKQGQ